MPKQNENYGPEEAAKRRDEVVRRMANTPPQPKLTSPDRQGKKKKAVEGRAARKDRAGRAR